MQKRLNVKWGADLEALAQAFYNDRASQKRVVSPTDVLSKRHCIVTPNRIMQAWLQQYFLYDYNGSESIRILANQDSQLVNVFVNDWLYRMEHPDKQREAQAHPYSLPNLQWRLFALLDRVIESPGYETLDRYVKQAGLGNAGVRRRYRLAGRLAKLYDDYQVFRPQMLAEWTEHAAVACDHPWQRELWQELLKEDANSYLSAFLKMEQGGLKQCNIDATYDRVSVFGVATISTVYLAFFHKLSEVVPVDFYVFSPGSANWCECLTPREAAQEASRFRLEGLEIDELDKERVGNPLLSSMGQGSRHFLGELLDFTNGDVNELPAPTDRRSPLALLQAQVASAESPGATASTLTAKDDNGRISLHLCHSPLREVEVLKDQILRWSAEDNNLQPRHIQVQVPDMATYAPYIQAVFATGDKRADRTIPYVIADRSVAATSPATAAFLQLLEVADGPFAAPEVVELLHCADVRDAFGFADHELDRVVRWIADSGIRWGQDANQRDKTAKVACGAATTWRHGFDRLLTGYIFGQATGDMNDWPIELPLPCDKIEGETVATLGRLVRFVDCLATVADRGGPLTAAEWVRELNDWITTFFKFTNENYADIRNLRDAVSAFETSSSAAGDGLGKIPRIVVQDFFVGQLDSAAKSNELSQNAVLFSALRPGSSVPRPYMCVLGMGDGLFPRSDRRAAYDVLREKPRRGDQSVRLEDRMAFLEALMSARRRLHLSHVGFSNRANESIPASTLITELSEYLDVQNIEYSRCRHRLQAFHHSYFEGETDGRFSYSDEDLRAAIAQRERVSKAGETETADGKSSTVVSGDPVDIDLDQLLRFLKNPAKHFCETVLGVKMDEAGGDLLADSEEFDPRGLTGYDLNRTVLDAIIAGRDRDRVYYELKERGLAPLGKWGRSRFDERWDEVAEFVGQKVTFTPSLKDTLKRQIDLKPTEIDITTAAGRVKGKVVVIKEEALRGVDCRYVKAKPLDKLQTWVRHLVVCASGVAGKRVCYVRDRSRKTFDATLFASIDREAACRHLAVLVRLYADGCRQAVPFLPASSFAWAETMRSFELADAKAPAERKSAEVASAALCAEDRRDVALDAALQAWEGAYMQTGDSADRYVHLAFGREGPLLDNRFRELAVDVFGPLLESAAEGEEQQK